jgi:hypothetical protein
MALVLVTQMLQRELLIVAVVAVVVDMAIQQF